MSTIKNATPFPPFARDTDFQFIAEAAPGSGVIDFAASNTPVANKVVPLKSFAYDNMSFYAKMPRVVSPALFARLNTANGGTKATGSITVSGTVHPPVQGTGTITLGGTSAIATVSAGTITFSGNKKLTDTVALTINGISHTYTLITGDDTAGTFATHFAAFINTTWAADWGLIVSAAAGAVNVTLASLATGTVANYALAVTYTQVGGSSTGAASVPGTMTGGAAADTIAVNLNSLGAQTYTLVTGDTVPATLATHLAAFLTAVAGFAAIATFTAGAVNVTVTAKAYGTTGNYTLATTYTQHGTGSSGTGTSSTMSGGQVADTVLVTFTTLVAPTATATATYTLLPTDTTLTTLGQSLSAWITKTFGFVIGSDGAAGVVNLTGDKAGVRRNLTVTVSKTGSVAVAKTDMASGVDGSLFN